MLLCTCPNQELLLYYYSFVHYYAPAPSVGGIKWWYSSDVCLDFRLSNTSGLSQEQRGLVRLNWHRGSPRHTWLKTPLSRSKGQRSTCRGRGHIVADSRTACYYYTYYFANDLRMCSLASTAGCYWLRQREWTVHMCTTSL